MAPDTRSGPIVILGAGPTGLGAAWRLHELGVQDFLLFEADTRPGGLAGSVIDPMGFTWDLGGHVQFSHYRYYDRVLDLALGSDWLWHERESWIWIANRFVPYPFQYNLHRLDPPARELALRGLEAAAANRAGTPRNFREWLLATFGEGLAGLFLFPYNEKVWGHPLDQMTWNWVGERVAVPDLDRVRQAIACHEDSVSWGPNNRFRFPLRGGTGAIWQAVAARLPPDRLHYGCAARRVALADRSLELEDGRLQRYGRLVSTIPLDRLAELAHPLSGPARAAGRALVHNTVHVLGIGLRGGRPPALRKKCWMYFPEANSPYYRVTVFSNYSPTNVPPDPGCWSLMAEVCESPSRPLDVTTLERWTRQALLEDRLIEPSAQIISFWHQRLDHGYPVPFLGRDAALGVLQDELARHDVYSRGRFGGWKYEVANQDHAFMQGVELADALVRGTPEITYVDPARANSGEFLQSSAPYAERTPA